jgi:hypothetical protein
VAPEALTQPVSSSDHGPAAPGAVNLIVFGRGLIREPDGTVLGLSLASLARVDAAIAYVEAHRDIFLARRHSDEPGRMVFSGGWAGAAAGEPPPPDDLREGSLMLQQARAGGVDGTDLAAYVDAFAETCSQSTLENAVLAAEGGYFEGRTFTPDNPLGLVAHAEHMKRVDYLTRKVFGLSRSSVRHIPAVGPDGSSPRFSESTLYRLTRIACLGATGPKALRRRERLMRTGTRLRLLGA